MLKIAKKYKIIIGLFAIFIFAIIGFFVFGKKEDVEYVTAKVKKGELIQTVSETGTIKASKEIDLNFLQTGKIAKINVEVGDNVKEGDVLAELDYSSLKIKEKEAKANLDIAKANLSKLLSGATSYEVNVSQASVDQAEATYKAYLDELEKTKKSVEESIAQAEKNLNDLLSNQEDDVTAYEQAVSVAEATLENTKATYSQSVDNYKEVALTTIEDKIAKSKSALDTINTILEDRDAQDLLSIKDFNYLNLTNTSYNDAQDLIGPAETSLDSAKSEKDEEKIYIAADDCIALLNKVFEALVNCYSALENSLTDSTFTQTDLDAYKTSIKTDQTTINTGVSAVQSAKQNLQDAVLAYETNVNSAEESLANAQASLDDAIIKAKQTLSSAKTSGDQQIAASQAKVDNALEAWNLAKAQYSQTVSPARSQDVILYQAKVRQAEANLELIQQQIKDSIIKAPIDGTITKVNYEVGEQISTISDKPVISILGENNFEIELDISEADIYKVKVGDPVIVDLDAFGSDIKFSAIVNFIEPAETIIQDVIYYKVKVKFINGMNVDNEYYKNIKSGMTANATITTAKKKDVLTVPGRAILERTDGSKYIRILENNNMVEKEVAIGLRGDAGMVEVLSGVNEGDEVVTQIKAVK